jgi:mxaL protein
MGRWGARLWLRAAALLVLACGLLVPPVRAERRVHDVLVVMDITASMNTRDVSAEGAATSRLDLEKRAAAALLTALPCGSRLSLGIFVEKVPFLLFEPLETCGNYAPLREEIGALDWRMGWDSESHIADALLASMRMAARLGSDLVFMTDGQESPPLWWTGMPKFSGVRGSVRGVIFGLGGNRLVPIPRYDSQNHQIGWYRPIDVPSDASGMFAGHGNMTAEDRPHLLQLSALSGLPYRHLDGTGAIYPAIETYGGRRMHEGWIDLAPGAAAIALALLLLAMVPLR